MKKLLIISDSLAIPREDTNYEDTWPYLIKKHFEFDVITALQRGSTTVRLVNDGPKGSDTLESYKPDVVIIQLGICDCAPRYFSYKVLMLLNKLPEFFTKYIWKLKKKFSSRKNAYISLDKFSENLDNYLSRCKSLGVKVIYVGILEASKEFIRKSPNIQKNIDLYNEVLSKLSDKYDSMDLIYPCQGEDIETVISDEHHLNVKGHKLLFEQIQSCLIKLGYSKKENS